MTPIAAMVKEMIARGVDADVIALAVETAEMSASVRGHSADKNETSYERRLRKDRERKQSVRRISADSAEIPRNSQDRHIIEDKNSKKEDTLDMPRKSVSADKRGHRLPDDWEPTPQDWATACAMHGEARAVIELAKFKDHWKSASGVNSTKRDWHAAWRNWVRNIRGSYADRTANPRTSGQSAFLAAATRKAQQLAGDHAMARSADPVRPASGAGVDGSGAPGFAGPMPGFGDGARGLEPDAGRTIEGEVGARDEARGWFGNGADVGLGSRRTA